MTSVGGLAVMNNHGFLLCTSSALAVYIYVRACVCVYTHALA